MHRPTSRRRVSQLTPSARARKRTTRRARRLSQAVNRPRCEAAARFGSPQWARNLVEARGEVCPSGRSPRLEREVVPAPLTLPEEGRRRLLPFELRLATGLGSLLLYKAGPFDELRCYQRSAGAGHSVEYLTCLEPRDFGSEAYEAYARLDLAQARELPPLRRQQGLWLRLRERGIRTLPQPRIREPTPEGLLRLEPRSGAPGTASDAEVREILRSATGLERVSWLEEAFRTPVPQGQALHRYYLGSDLTLYLVRQVKTFKSVTIALPTAKAARRGLLIYGSSP